MAFEILFSKKAQRDFAKLSSREQDAIAPHLAGVETKPYPFKNKIKKIKGTKLPLYRLRIETSAQSYRVFYAIAGPDQVIILRIVPKKDADRILAKLK